MSGLGAAAIAVGLIFTPLTVLMVKDLGFSSFALAVLGGQAAVIIVGILLMALAPKQAKRQMDKRIVEDLEYARYIVHAYPDVKEHVRELQPGYYEDASHPIVDYEKIDNPKLPLWRKILFVLLMVGLLVVSYYLSSK